MFKRKIFLFRDGAAISITIYIQINGRLNARGYMISDDK